MVKMHIVIMDYESNTVHAFDRDYEVDADVEYELTESGEFNPDTSYLLFSPHDIRIIIEGTAGFVMHNEEVL